MGGVKGAKTRTQRMKAMLWPSEMNLLIYILVEIRDIISFKKINHSCPEFLGKTYES